LPLSKKKTTWLLKRRKKEEGTKSERVLKLKVRSNKDSPKKKKKHQKEKRRYIVDLDVKSVNWNLKRRLDVRSSTPPLTVVRLENVW
jgi:hypothetical protein